MRQERQLPSESAPPQLPAGLLRPDSPERRNAPPPWLGSACVRDRQGLSAPCRTPRSAGLHLHCGLPVRPRVAFGLHRTSATVLPLSRHSPALRNSSAHVQTVSHHRYQEFPAAAFGHPAPPVRLRTAQPSPGLVARQPTPPRGPAPGDSLQHPELPLAGPPIVIFAPSRRPRMRSRVQNASSAQRPVNGWRIRTRVCPRSELDRP